jgi:hypothetical protein
MHSTPSCLSLWQTLASASLVLWGDQSSAIPFVIGNMITKVIGFLHDITINFAILSNVTMDNHHVGMLILAMETQLPMIHITKLQR